MTTATDCPIWCKLFTTGQHKQMHGAHKASYAGATAQASAALVHRPGASELTVEITMADPSGAEHVAEITAMAAMDLAQALTALITELARIGSAAPLAWPPQDQPSQDQPSQDQPSPGWLTPGPVPRPRPGAAAQDAAGCP